MMKAIASGSPTRLDEDEVKALHDSVNRFIDQHVEPHWASWAERQGISREYYRQLGQAGYLGTDLPLEYGGSDAGFYPVAELLKGFCRAGHFVHGGLLLAQHYVVAHLLNNEQVSTAVKQEFLPALIAGDMIPALAISEPQGGSDLRNTRSRAIPTKDGYLLSGSKTFISNANIADFFIFFAMTDSDKGPGLTAFMVRADAAGVEVGRPLKKVGMHTGNTAELFLSDVYVSADDVLGLPGQGLALLGAGMPRERAFAGICSTALCDAALQWTTEYVKERSLYGNPLWKLQNTRFVLSDFHAQWQIFDAFMDQLIDEMANSTLTPERAAIARLKGAQLCNRVVTGCSELFGGYGFMEEYPIARLSSDVRGMGFWGGCNELIQESIARPLFRA